MDDKTLASRLDKLISVVVRANGKRCVTCGKLLPFNRRQAGHYIPRAVKRTRWDLHNVHTQCQDCNVALGGNIPKYDCYIKKTYGDSEFRRLNNLYCDYKHGTAIPMSRQEREAIYSDLLMRVRSIENEAGKQLVPDSWK